MPETTDPPAALPSATQNRPMSTPALVLGLISLVAWIIPIIGIPMSATALIVGICSLARHGYTGKATAGVVLAAITLFAGLINAWVGAQIGAEIGYRAGQCANGNYAYCNQY